MNPLLNLLHFQIQQTVIRVVFDPLVLGRGGRLGRTRPFGRGAFAVTLQHALGGRHRLLRGEGLGDDDDQRLGSAIGHGSSRRTTSPANQTEY